MTRPATEYGWPPGRGAATSYHGRRETTGSARGATIVYASNTEAGWTAPLVHFVRHSPSGFEWGYAGSGPADLARSLIIDAIGPAARCPDCHGTRKTVLDLSWDGDPAHEPSVPYDPARHAAADPLAITTCIFCDDGIRQLPYHDFKFAVVAYWKGDTWTYTRAELLDQLTCFYPPGAIPSWLHDLAIEAT